MLIVSTMLMLGCGLRLASGLGQPWTRDGGIPQGCPLSVMFIVALYLPWCRYLAAHDGEFSLSYMLINLKCVSRDPDLLLNAARFNTGYVQLVGQEPAPSKCVLISTSREVRRDLKEWVLSQEGIISGLSSLMFVIWEGGRRSLGYYFSLMVFYFGC